MKSVDSVPLMVSDSEESVGAKSCSTSAPIGSGCSSTHHKTSSSTERKRRLRRLAVSRRAMNLPHVDSFSEEETGTAAITSSTVACHRSRAGTQIELEMCDLPVRIEIRRCSQVSRSDMPLSPLDTSMAGCVASNPDLWQLTPAMTARHDAIDSHRYGRGGSWAPDDPGTRYLQVGTPPELRRHSYDQSRHSRSQSCRLTRRPVHLTIPDTSRWRSHSQEQLNGGRLDPTMPAQAGGYYRLRHFSITGQGIINRGDSIKLRHSHSCASVASDCSECSGRSSRGLLSLMCGSRGHSGASSSSRSSCCVVSPANTARHRPYVSLVLGAGSVGKTSLVHQFMTSEYMNAYEIGSIDEDSCEKSVSVLLDGKESEMLFVDAPNDGSTLEQQISQYRPDAFVVVYSVTDSHSVEHAESIIQKLWKMSVVGNKAVIIVASKSDLVRSRKISQQAGRKLASVYNCKFIEVSGGLNHRVDDLLVGVLSQIRLKEECRLSRSRSLTRHSVRLRRGTRKSASFKGLLNVVCGKDVTSKSCENLQVE